MFREWDEDASGSVSKKEFRKAMPLLGLDVPRSEMDALFDSWDADGSGSLELKELNKRLRAGASVELAANLRPGAAGEIATESKNKHGLRKGKPTPTTSAFLRGLDIDESSSKSVGEQARAPPFRLRLSACPRPTDHAGQIREALSAHAVRVIESATGLKPATHASTDARPRIQMRV